jgi:hypothetical protein
MRIVRLYILVIVFALVFASAGFAQQSREGYSSEVSEKIARSLKSYQAIFGPVGPAALSALCMPLAQPLQEECKIKVEDVTRLFRNTVTLLKDQPEKVDALPDVYEKQYKRGQMSNMSVTDQISWARFQYAYIGFLTWYVKCYPLPAVDNIPLRFPHGPVGERAPDEPPPASPPASQSPRLLPK